VKNLLPFLYTLVIFTRILILWGPLNSHSNSDDLPHKDTNVMFLKKLAPLCVEFLWASRSLPSLPPHSGFPWFFFLFCGLGLQSPCIPSSGKRFALQCLQQVFVCTIALIVCAAFSLSRGHVFFPISYLYDKGDSNPEI
jgi:hypothetical protein